MNNTLPKRYASSIFELAKEENALCEVFEQLKLVEEVFEANREIKLFFANFGVAKEIKLKIIDEIMTPKFNKNVINLMKLLVEKGRIQNLGEICKEFKKIYYEHEKIQEVTAISAVELSQEQRQGLVVALQKRLEKSIELSELIDSSIVGGLLIKYGDKMLDASIRGRMIRLRKAMLL